MVFEFLVVLMFILIAFAGMALGVLFGRSPLKGSCGGLGNDCSLCGGRATSCPKHKSAG